MALTRKNRIVGRLDIKKALSSRRIFTGSYFSLKVLRRGNGLSRFMVVIPTRLVPLASSRNALRRIISETLQGMAVKIQPGYDGVVQVRVKTLPSKTELLSDILTLLKKSGMLKQ